MNGKQHDFADGRRNGSDGTVANEDRKVMYVMHNRASLKDTEDINAVGIANVFFRILDNIWFVLISALLCALIGAAYALFFMTPKYEATAKLYVSGGIGIETSYSVIQANTALAADYMEAFDTREVREIVLGKLDLDYNHDQLQDMVKIDIPEDTRMMHITVSHADAQLAADIANAYAEAGISFISDTMSAEAPRLISAAVAADRASTHGVVFYIAMGFAVGLVLMVCITAVVVILEDKPDNPEEIFRTTGIPVMAVIPAMKKRRLPAGSTGGLRK